MELQPACHVNHIHGVAGGVARRQQAGRCHSHAVKRVNCAGNKVA